ncbi:hypothetical protein BB560_006139 [Smittium megazygosporum]|uniref:Small ribosomal subunit protein mS23 n=1 Tax=Smittium megazygosporum TaxID=133381 RepID=A0A2T9YG73_9FUNG|nr:hypothetical protein BB560_006139 [Smittium megazygosporum]
MSGAKATAREVYGTYTKLLKGGLRKEKPAWYTSMELYPPNPSIYCNPNYFKTSGTNEFEKNATEGDVARKGFFLPPRSAHKKHNMKTLRMDPPAIKYPEDKLRERFYKEYPDEASNPISFVESGNPKHKWDSTNNPAFGLTGESVIRYQWYLMNQGLSEEEAYKLATGEFEASKGEVELEKFLATQEAFAYNQYPFEKLYSKLTLRMEEKQLNISKKVIQTLNQM